MLQIDEDPKKSTVVEDSWYLDPRLIEPEMLLSEGPEADKIYQELKERAIRRKRQMENENALGGLLEEPEVVDDGDEEQKDSRLSLTGSDAILER